jgi:Mn2+/Fe2+ NRAMP family transporter
MSEPNSRNLPTAAQAASRFDYSLLWVIALSTVLMIFFTGLPAGLLLSLARDLMEASIRGAAAEGAAGVWPGVNSENRQSDSIL